MAISKTISANGSKGHHYFSLNVTESYTSGNSSYMSGSFSLGPIQTGWDWNNWGDRISYSFNIGSNQFTGSIPRYDGSSVLYLQTFNNVEIPHESNGKKTIDISFSVTDTTGANYTSGNASASDTMSLTELHKAPEIQSVSVLETGFNDSVGVADYTLINLLSVKHFLLNNIVFYDNATLKKVDISGENFSFSFNSNTEDDITNVTCWFSNFNINSSKTTLPVLVKITDSLGGTDETVVNFTYVNYQQPNIVETQSNVKRNGQLTGKARLNLLGSFSNLKIGNTQNTIQLKYRYWEYGTTPSETLSYIDIPGSAYTIDNNTISIYNWSISNNNVEITDLDKSKAYNFEIKLSDSFSETTSSGTSFIVTLVCSKGEWVMAKFKDRVDFQKITVGGYNPFKYSENETIVGEWIDGRPIYRKVINSSTSLSAGYNYINHGINNFDKLVNHRLYLYYDTDVYVGGAFQDETTFVTLVYVSPEKANINVGSTWGSSFTSGFTLILEYIKTTNEGGL